MKRRFNSLWGVVATGFAPDHLLVTGRTKSEAIDSALLETGSGTAAVYSPVARERAWRLMRNAGWSVVKVIQSWDLPQ